jgi:hypothetical protein
VTLVVGEGVRRRWSTPGVELKTSSAEPEAVTATQASGMAACSAAMSGVAARASSGESEYCSRRKLRRRCRSGCRGVTMRSSATRMERAADWRTEAMDESGVEQKWLAIADGEASYIL